MADRGSTGGVLASGHAAMVRRAVTTAGPADAPPLVLLHGTRRTRAMWRLQLDGLAEAFRVIAVDLPGHGALADVPFRLADASDFVAAVIDEIAGGRAIVVGSVAGRVRGDGPRGAPARAGGRAGPRQRHRRAAHGRPACAADRRLVPRRRRRRAPPGTPGRGAGRDGGPAGEPRTGIATATPAGATATAGSWPGHQRLALQGRDAGPRGGPPRCRSSRGWPPIPGRRSSSTARTTASSGAASRRSWPRRRRPPGRHPGDRPPRQRGAARRVQRGGAAVRRRRARCRGGPAGCRGHEEAPGRASAPGRGVARSAVRAAARGRGGRRGLVVEIAGHPPARARRGPRGRRGPSRPCRGRRRRRPPTSGRRSPSASRRRSWCRTP